MSFDFRQLRYAIAAADYRSIHRASEVLEIKRSTLSRSIFCLEHCMGAKLFIRTPTGIFTTTAGKDFIREARQIVSRADQLIDAMRSVGQGRSGGLMIGHHSPISAGNLRATLFGWHASNPDIEVDGIEAEREDLINGLKEGVIDVAIMIGEASYPGMNRATFWSERLLVAMPASHTLAEREWVQWHDLRNETFLLTVSDPGPEIRDMLLGRLSAFGLRPKIKMHAVSRESIMSVLGGGLGVTITCEGAAGAQYPDVVLREVHGSHGLCLMSYSGYWRKDTTNPALRHFLAYVRSRYSLTFDLS